MLDIKEKKFLIGDKEVVLRTGEYALQANGSVTLRCGDTLVQAVVSMGEAREGIDFFPLSVEYNESLYAGGIIKSSKFMKREGKPNDEAILKARLIDRSIRPYFHKDFCKEVQVVVNVLSIDKENPHDVLGLTAAIAAIGISDIPFDSHLAGIRLSLVDGKLIVNPTYDECAKQNFELVLAGSGDKIVMIECGAKCVKDELITDAFMKSYEVLGSVASNIEDFVKKYGKTKIEYEPKSIKSDLEDMIKATAVASIENYYVKFAKKEADKSSFSELVAKPVLELFKDKETEYSQKEILEALDKIFKSKIRENILVNKRRIDGRSVDEIREIQIDINPIPRVHGSAMFMRGETQVLNILTLGAPGNAQVTEAIEGESLKKYIHHYNAPPYSVGETGRIGTPGRREIGHGALAEKALKPVIPEDEKFPYMIRLVSEVMGQNGSSSMASTCASTLSLMAGGVPIKEPVAGISVGLMTGENIDNFVTITDIMGVEDFSGDMDFKVAGTRETITAIQMDTKIKGLSKTIVKQALDQARIARNRLLDIMKTKMPDINPDISIYAPRIEFVQIPVDTIGKVIGPGGKMIKQISADFGVELNIDDDGKVSIAGQDKTGIMGAKKLIEGMVKDPVVGTIYEGKITRILDFGMVVEIFPGKDGLVHISRISKERVNNINDLFKIGEIVKVRLFEIDSQGRLNLSMMLDDTSNDNTRRNDSSGGKPRDHKPGGSGGGFKKSYESRPNRN